ncbi:hypothetical protein BDV09DRAFT_166493 [Aspergillus tetrazonus]
MHKGQVLCQWTPSTLNAGTCLSDPTEWQDRNYTPYRDSDAFTLDSGATIEDQTLEAHAGSTFRAGPGIHDSPSI